MIVDEVKIKNEIANKIEKLKKKKKDLRATCQAYNGNV